jgi:hypothetical protein
LAQVPASFSWPVSYHDRLGSSKAAQTLKIDNVGSAILEKAGKVFDEFMNEQEDL